VAGVGCAQRAVSSVDVATSGSLRRAETDPMPSVRVDVVGVSKADEDKIKAYPVRDWYGVNDQRRANYRSLDLVKSLTFTGGTPQTQSIPANDPIWKAWRSAGASTLYVFAQSSNISPDEKGADSGWRRAMSLNSEEWNKATRLAVSVGSDGVSITPVGGKGAR